MRFSDFLDSETAQQTTAPVRSIEPSQPADLPPDAGALSPTKIRTVAVGATLPPAPTATYEHVLGPPPTNEPSPFAELLSPPRSAAAPTNTGGGLGLAGGSPVALPVAKPEILSQHVELETAIEAIIVVQHDTFGDLDQVRQQIVVDGFAPQPELTAVTQRAPSIDDDLLPSKRKPGRGRVNR